MTAAAVFWGNPTLRLTRRRVVWRAISRPRSPSTVRSTREIGSASSRRLLWVWGSLPPSALLSERHRQGRELLRGSRPSLRSRKIWRSRRTPGRHRFGSLCRTARDTCPWWRRRATPFMPRLGGCYSDERTSAGLPGLLGRGERARGDASRPSAPSVRANPRGRRRGSGSRVDADGGGAAHGAAARFRVAQPTCRRSAADAPRGRGWRAGCGRAARADGCSRRVAR